MEAVSEADEVSVPLKNAATSETVDVNEEIIDTVPLLDTVPVAEPEAEPDKIPLTITETLDVTDEEPTEVNEGLTNTKEAAGAASKVAKEADDDIDVVGLVLAVFDMVAI